MAMSSSLLWTLVRPRCAGGGGGSSALMLPRSVTWMTQTQVSRCGWSVRSMASMGAIPALKEFSKKKKEKKVPRIQQVTSVDAELKRYRPFTPGMRHTVLVSKKALWSGRPIKELTRPHKKSGGRNHTGRRVSKNVGGGVKQRIRLVDFKRDKYDEPAIIQRFEHDPLRSAFIALIVYEDGTLSYIIAAQGMKVGDRLLSTRDQEIPFTPGNAMPLLLMPIGIPFHCLETISGNGAVFARSAGVSAILKAKHDRPGFGLVQIASKEQRYVPLDCMATIGVVSNPMHHLQNYGKAGRMRWKGKRPHVRGVAMNPVDHPMGGGEGKSSGGRPSCSRTGLLAKGYKTKRKKWKLNKLIVIPRGGMTKKRGR